MVYLRIILKYISMTYAKDWYNKNRKKHLLNCKKYYLQDKEGHKKKTRQWQKDHPNEQKEIRMRTYYKNKEKENERSRNYTKHRKELVLKAYGGKNPKCRYCEIEDIDILTLDHIYNDGASDRKKIGKLGSGFYGWLIKNNFPNKERFQILCQNCNIKKYHNIKKTL